MTNNQDDRSTVIELVGRARTAMLTTLTAEDDRVSRPMAVQEVEVDGDLWFFTHDDSRTVRHIQAHPRANVSLANDDKSEWTSISGTAEVVHDRQRAEELWSKPLET